MYCLSISFPLSLSLSRLDGKSMPMRVRSMVGIIPLFACLVLEDEVIQKLPGFKKRLTWFLTNRKDLAKQVRHYMLLWVWLVYFIIKNICFHGAIVYLHFRVIPLMKYI